MTLQAAVELDLFSIAANIWTDFVFTAAAPVKVWLPYASTTPRSLSWFCFPGMVCLVDHERIPNDVYWHGKGSD